MPHPYLKFPAGPIGAIVHVGAGLCDGLDSYLASAPTQLLLIEPNPQYAAELARKTAADVVLEQAIAPQKGQAPFHILNFADLSCLKAPDGLRDLLPGIRVVKTPMVDTGPLSDILARTPLDGARFNTLVIEAVGEELAILQDLIDTGHLAGFKQIALRTGRTPYFAGAGTPDSVKTLLDAQGYRLETVFAHDDPDWPVSCFAQDPLMLKNNALQDELAGVKAAAAAELKTAKDTAEQDAAATAQQIASLQAEGAELRAVLAKAEQDKAATAQQVSTLQSEALGLRDAHAKTLQDLETAQTQLKAAQDQQQQFDTRIAAADTQKADLATALSESRSRENSALADLRVSVKMQSLVRADFDDLQQRYQTLLQEKTDQEDLLSQLTQKLESAARHLRLMSSDAAETPVSALDEAVKEPAAVPKAAPEKTPKKPPKKPAPKKTAVKAPRKDSGKKRSTS